MPGELLQFEKLGGKTLAILILRKFGIFVLVLLIAIAIIFTARYIPAAGVLLDYLPAIFGALLLIFLITIFFGWLEYGHYHISVNDDDVRITRGIVSEEEIGIPYRRIKEVKIERGILEEILGTSMLLITVLGEEGGDVASKESVISLSALDKTIATRIQDALLKKAEVEEINVDPQSAKQA